MPSYRAWLSGIKAGAAVTALAIGAAAFAAAPVSAAASTAANPAAGGWRTVPGPAFAAGASANLTALAMAGPSLGWTAGFTLANNQNAPFEPLLAAWNGHRWRTVPVNLGTDASGRLDGLADQSSDNAWAVGTASVASDSLQPLILHWNGRQWACVPGAGVPGFGYVSLLGVAVRSATDAWAVGEAPAVGKFGMRPVIEHWNGRRWQLLANPPHLGEGNESWGFTAVTTTGHGDLIAVGSAGSATVGRALYGTWNGRDWSLSTGPRITQLSAVSPDGQHAIWAVGSENPSNQVIRPVIQVSG